MRIFLLPLFTLALLGAGATPVGSGADAGTQVDYGIVEGSGDATKAISRTLFLDPSYIVEGIRALRTTSAIRALAAPKPSPSDFWELAKKSENVLQDYVPRLLKSAAMYFKSTKFTDITSAMNQIVIDTTAFRDNIKETLDARHVTLDTITEELEGIFMGIVSDLEKLPPPDKAPGHAEREKMVDEVLDDTTRELKKLATRYGIEEEAVSTYLLSLKPQLRALIVAVGDINEQYPQLFPTLAFSIAVLLIPESWILRPFLSLFGFGPTGPVKRSAAALLQSRFWGATVESGTWFSWLQAAGMGVIPKWAGLLTKLPLLAGGALAMLLPCCKRG